METRKIMVANTRTQKREEIMTNATTLAELKAAMDGANIDYSGMDFTEGISKTRLISDDSLLPTNVMYKGQPTNDLVILLTNTSKKVASGCGDRSRSKAYEIINEQGEDFKQSIKDAFGVNYTLITTENLWLFIDEHLPEEDENDEDDDDDEDYDDCLTSNDLMVHLCNATIVAGKLKVLTYKQLFTIAESITAVAQEMKEREEKHYSLGNSTISDGDIDEMIASV